MTARCIGAAAAVLALFGTTGPMMAQGATRPDSSIVIHEQYDFAVPPAQIYTALTDGKAFAAFTGAAATIEAKAGGAFSLFEGHIVGRNVQLVQNRRVVQAWRADDWPEGTFSVVRFELMPHGTGTRLMFDHTGFPPGLRAHLIKGWEDHYWALFRKNLK